MSNTPEPNHIGKKSSSSLLRTLCSMKSVVDVLGRTLGMQPGVHLQDFEAQPLTASEAPPELGAAPERRRGRYLVLGEVARGGIGVIYRVRDADIGRDLALKILDEPHRANEEAKRRFVEEAQITGQLQHPGVVPVHEIGLLDGEIPYFTMKLVKGETLAPLLEKRHSVTADRQYFLNVFEQVAQTLAYAHARGVIHRDLKPSNIMVGAFGEVQVMDWGLAKVLAEGGVADERRARKTHARPEVSVIQTIRSESTGSDSLVGSVMGTPAYMPPEQARGEVEGLDERADVFGLGAMLCEILTGRPPYCGKTKREVYRKACEAALDEARQRLEECGAEAELVALAMDCLAAEPRDRPRDAVGVSREMRAYLETMEERTRTAEREAAEDNEKARGERKARRLTAAIWVTLLLALCVGGGGFALFERERESRVAAAAGAVELAIAEASSLRAEVKGAASATPARWDAVVEAAERAVSLLTADVDESVRQRAVEFLEAVEADKAQAREAARLAEKDRAFTRRLESLRMDQAHCATPFWPGSTAGELAEAYEDAFRDYGIDVTVLDVPEAAERIGATAIAGEIARALDDWGRALRSSRRSGGAEWKRLLEIAGQADADPVRGRLRRAVAAADTKAPGALAAEILQKREPSNERETENALSRGDRMAGLPPQTLDLLAQSLLEVGDHGTARDLYRKALQLHPGDFWLHHNAAIVSLTSEVVESHRHVAALSSLRKESPHVWRDLGEVLVLRRDFDAAVPAFTRAVLLSGEAGEEDHGAARERLGDALARTGDLTGAAEAYAGVVDLRPAEARVLKKLGEIRARGDDAEGAVEAFGQAVAVDPRDGAIRTALGLALEKTGNLEAAIATYRRSLRLEPGAADTHYLLGSALLRLDRPDEAAAHLLKATELDPLSAAAHLELAIAVDRAANRGGTARALAAIREAIRLTPAEAVIDGERIVTMPAVGTTLGGIRPPGTGRAERSSSGRVYLERSLAILRKESRSHPEDAALHEDLGMLHLELGHFPEAVSVFRVALDLDPARALAHAGAGLALLLQDGQDERDQQAGAGREMLDAALPSLRRALELEPANPTFRNNLAVALYRRGRVTDAAAALRKALQSDPRHATAHFNLGVALAREKRHSEAIRAFRQSIRSNSANPAAHERLGESLIGVGEYAEAVGAFRRALELAPQSARALAGLGTALDSQGKLEEALAVIRESLRIDPSSARTHMTLGLVQVARGEVDAGIESFRDAIRLDKHLWEAADHMGQTYLQEKRYDLAMDAFRRAVEADPMRDTPYSRLIDLLQKPRQPDYGLALEDLVHSLDGILSSPGRYHASARHLYLLAWSRSPGSLPDASKPLRLARQEVAASNRQDARALSLLARVLFATGARAEAIRTLEESLDVAADPVALEAQLREYRAAVLPDLLSYASIDAAVAEREEILPPAARWRYFPGTEEPSADLEWTQTDFDDRGWAEGKAPLGYGDGGEGTLLEEMLGYHTTLYLRTTFTLPAVKRFDRVLLAVRADDGFVAYVGGQEVGRARAGRPNERLSHDARASTAAEEPLEVELIEIPRQTVAPGENLLAVQGLNDFAENLDFFLEVSVVGELTPAAKRSEFAAFREAASADSARLAYLDGLLFEREGKQLEAAASFRRVLDLDRSSVEPFLRLEQSLKAAHDPRSALEALESELEKGGVPPRLLALPPSRPVAIAPGDGATVPAGVTLEATPYFRYDVSSKHFSSHWQIRAEGASYAYNATTNRIDDRNLDSWTLPQDLLLPRTTYHWRVSYTSTDGTSTGFSAEASFTTADFPARWTSFDLSPYFNRDVIADPGDPDTDELDGGAWALTVEGFDGARSDNPEVRGLPGDRRIGVHLLGAYGGPNALQFLRGDEEPVRIAVPAARYSSLRFLVTGGNGSSHMPLVLEFAGGARVAGELSCADWFFDVETDRVEGCEPVWDGMDRMSIGESPEYEERDDAALFEVRLAVDRDLPLEAILLDPAHGDFSQILTHFNLLAITGRRVAEESEE